MASSSDFVELCLEDVVPLPGWLHRNMRMLSSLDHRASSIALHVERKKRAYLKSLKDGKRLEKKCRKAAALADHDTTGTGAAESLTGSTVCTGGISTGTDSSASGYGLLNGGQPRFTPSLNANDNLNYKRRQQRLQYEALTRRCAEDLEEILVLERTK
eukprot:Lankesteria_metandrocarpae@DN9748_c0_g1_i1.p1